MERQTRQRDAGDVLRVDLPGQPTRYEAQCDAGHGQPGHHHHHFHCDHCDRVFLIHACPGPMDALAPAGFQVERHDLTLHGRCADCARPARRRVKPAPSAANP